MPGGYWWECESCRSPRRVEFPDACGARGIAHYIQDSLRLNWDQSLLLRDCPDCRSHSLRITYEFPRKDRSIFRVFGVVGLDRDKNGEYVPMMWETRELDPATLQYYPDSIFDFKYICGRKTFGLNKAAVFTQAQLRDLFTLYSQKRQLPAFP